MLITLLDDSLKIDVTYEPSDKDYEDNVCLRMWEDCPEDEKVFYASETNLYITPEQARAFADALLKAADCSGHGTR